MLHELNTLFILLDRNSSCNFFGWKMGMATKRGIVSCQRFWSDCLCGSTGGILWLAVGETRWVDQQVKKLCAKDGGVKVYETVTLPIDKFDKWGNVHLNNKKYAKTIDEYYYESENIRLKQGNPQLWRYHTLFYRQSDGKLLGELISYGRGSGGLPGPWRSSSFSCPDPIKQPSNIEKLILLKAE